MNFGLILLGVLSWVLNLYTYVILASALISWLFLPPDNPVVRFLRFLTEPVLAPCRSLLARIVPYNWRRFDFSPILALLAIQILIYILHKITQYLMMQ